MLAGGVPERAGHRTHCMEPIACVGRWKFLKVWTKLWSCEWHADELMGLGAYLQPKIFSTRRLIPLVVRYTFRRTTRSPRTLGLHGRPGRCPGPGPPR
jgi:hypothetical protein